MMQENEEDFVSLPTKNDPKYQTLPYNAKLFAPFGTKQDQEQFEKSMQQMQLIKQDQQQVSQSAATAQLQFQVQQYRQQQQSNQQQSNHLHNNGGIGSNDCPTNNERVQSYNNKNNLHLNQLQSFLSQQQQHQNNQSGPHNNAQVNNSSKSTNDNNNAFPIIRPSNFLPTGAPASSPSTSGSSSNNSPQISSFNGFMNTAGQVRVSFNHYRVMNVYILSMKKSHEFYDFLSHKKRKMC
jgi:hypothetical protein